tara:strand:+ start:91 stop:738 length:648 start_codon:yes stop_codon:yes gene_type:complete
MSEEVKYKIIKNFGPSVFKIQIPKSIVDKLNNYIDKTIQDEQKLKELDYGNNLVGHVTQEFLLERDIIEGSGWLKFLSMSVHKWIELETGNKIKRFNLNSSWIIRQFQNEFNPIHWHTGHISGAGFLKVPKSFGEHKQKLKHTKYTGGNLQLVHGSKMFLCDSTFSIKPEVGDFYFFPNYLMHTVYPFSDTDEERRSISFNANIDDDIYDVYRRK